MPVNVQKETTKTSSGPVSDQVSQTSTAAQVPTSGEVIAAKQEAESDRGNAWVWYIVGVIDLLLLLRIVFYLAGAESVGFANLLYGITGPLVAPFRGIFPNPDAAGSYFDMAALAAIVIFALLGWIVSRLIDLATRPANSKKI